MNRLKTKSLLPWSIALLLCAGWLVGCGGGESPSGQTYYLDASNGDDAGGDGSQTKPYKTVAKLWPRLQGGDLVLLASGNYPAFVAGRTWPANDTDKGWNCSPVDVFSDWVTFRAAPGQDPHFAAIDLGTWNAAPGSALPFSQIGNHDAYLRFDGVSVDDGVSIMGSRHVEIMNSRIHRQGSLVGSMDNINNKEGITVRNGRHITIAGNDITHVAIGVSVASTDFIMRGNKVHDNSHDGMQIYGGNNLLVEGNQFHDMDDGLGDNPPLPDWDMHVDGIHVFINNYAPKMPNDLDGLTIRGNVFYHLESMGIMVNGTSPPTTNYRNFVFENNVMGGVGGNMLHWGARIDGFIFRHNTIVYSPVTTWTSPYRTLSTANYNVSWWPDGAGKQIYNNIFVDGKSSQPDPGDTSFALIANNLYKTAPQKPLQRGEALMTALPYAEGDWTATLLPGSQAIDAGTRLGGDFKPLINPLEVDINGVRRDNRPDIGAFEVPGRNPTAETAATYGH